MVTGGTAAVVVLDFIPQKLAGLGDKFVQTGFATEKIALPIMLRR